MWPCWRLWFEKLATLEELETTWSVHDVLDANEILDAMQEADRKSRPKKGPKP